MMKVIEIPRINGNIVVYLEGSKFVISNNTEVDLKIDGKEQKAHTIITYE